MLNIYAQRYSLRRIYGKQKIKELKITRSAAVTKKADRTVYDVWYSCRTEPPKMCPEQPRGHPWLFQTRKFWRFGFLLCTVSERYILVILQQKCPIVSEQEVPCYIGTQRYVQLSTLYTDPECHNALRYRRTDRRTDDSIMPRADNILRVVYDRL